MRILLEELSIINMRNDKIFYVDLNVKAIFRLFKFLKEDKCFKEKHDCI